MIAVLKPFAHWLASTEWFMRVGPRFVPQVDRVLYRLTRGRMISSDRVVPSLVLFTTGAKSGLERRSPLACLPEQDGGFIVVGSNFGRETHPAWSANLIKNPEARVSHRGREIPVVATLLTGEARVEAWPRLTANWPLYDRYADKSGRELRVFRLTPVQ
ncbi:nitroreductase family deazaflavin-dependent oxidoreductase [Nonomuraea lactucae]|uniref:nitroreductase family deazaflavin-dependent oxidoreductase n=1 Tax=Nonomuraea lactucae TaxID=2249762 RepID=UPI000DE2CDFB|nr:nitroreductase family deazaflavin-dependent oxidoreductase [Nonomuraea lactucae]